MSIAELRAVGYRWTKPTWERSGDRSWVLIVPSSMLKDPDLVSDRGDLSDSAERLYEVYEFDGSWVDQLHECQIDRLLRSPHWRSELR
jgi:hypothetical protein